MLEKRELVAYLFFGVWLVECITKTSLFINILKN